MPRRNHPKKRKRTGKRSESYVPETDSIYGF